MKPEIIVAGYCEDCPHFNPESNVIYSDNKTALMTYVQCVYREQCRHAAEYTAKKCNKALKDKLKNQTPVDPVIRKVCDCWHPENAIPTCWGVKEKPPCTCGGDKDKCDFYGG